MIRINLLPYRAARRRGQILKYLLVALVSLLLTGMALLASYSWSSMELADAKGSLQNLQDRNKALRVKIGELSQFKEVQVEVQKKLDLVDKLQGGRFRSLESLHALAQAIPKNVWLTQITDNGGTISISGRGESNRAVSSFMRALEEQKVFSGVRLQVIKREGVGGVALRSFSLTMNRVEAPSAGEGKDLAGGGKGS